MAVTLLPLSKAITLSTIRNGNFCGSNCLISSNLISTFHLCALYVSVVYVFHPMNTINRYYAACCQTDFPSPASRTEIKSRVDRMLEMIDSAVLGYEPFSPVRLVVFPGFAHTPPVYTTAPELEEKLAVPIPNEHTERYTLRARHHGIYIQTGTFLELDDAYPGAVFNTTCLIGPTGILAKYRKTHPWIPWEVSASPHDIAAYKEDPYPVVESDFTKRVFQRTPSRKLGTKVRTKVR